MPDSSMLEKILKARVYDHGASVVSALEPAKKLSKRLGFSTWLKREDQQPVFSFKCRGAFNHIFHLSEEQKQNGIICASAGNHAQGVAQAADKLGLQAVIVMPLTTPPIKVQAVRDLGGEVDQQGNSFDEAAAYAKQRAERDGLTFVHPFDDEMVIAGQGTVGLEIHQAHPQPIEAIFVPVGGGGLLSGIGAFFGALRPDVNVIAVEPEDSACLDAAFKAGQPTPLDYVDQFADGVAVRQIGETTFQYAQHYVCNSVITVSTDEMCAAIKDVFEETRSLVEPAGALAVAGMKKYCQQQRENYVAADTPKGDLVALVSGANINFNRLRYVAERAELGQQREALIVVSIPEQPGSFRRLYQDLGNGDYNVSEFRYRYSGEESAHILVGIQLPPECKADLIHKLEQDFTVYDTEYDELAKAHLRFMVGGHKQCVAKERIYRLEFPERPGTLGMFLDGLQADWNISLFHYRNYGADVGSVLIGFQVPENQQAVFEQFLIHLGYFYEEVTDNQIYQLFLG